MGNQKMIESSILENLKFIRKPNQVVEIRILNTIKGTVSGYYDDYYEITSDIRPYIGKYDIYFTLNPVNKDLIARSANRLTLYSKTTTSDQNIEKISYILIDLDPVRPSGISSTDEEKKCAYQKAKEIYNFLSQNNWPKPIVSDSGNGYHLLYAVELTNDAENIALLKQLLVTLDQLFSDDNTQVDKTTFNPARIVKLYGTTSCKGDSIPERPHRWSNIVYKPKSVVNVSKQQIMDINDLYRQVEQPHQKNESKTSKIDVEELIRKHSLGEYTKSPWNNATKYVLKKCPFNEDHQDSSACIIQFDNGAISVKCHHESCSENNWSTLKAKLGIKITTNKKTPSEKDEEAQKESVSDVLLRLTYDYDFFSDELEEAYVKISLEESTKVVKVKSDYFKKWLTKLYYDETEKAVTAEGLNQAINVLEAKGLFSKDGNRKLFQRVAKFESSFYYDLFDGEGSVVKIGNNGCCIVPDVKGIFNQRGSMCEQVKPNFNVSSKKLIELVTNTFNFKSKKDAILYLVYLVTCFIPEISHPILILHGEKGAAKSTTMRFTRMLVDPSKVPLISMSNKIDDLAGTISKTHMICFDNLATISSNVSDLLCMASTGGGYTKRKLYTDDEEVTYNFKRCICLNGINVVATQADLLDRSLLIELERIGNGTYQTDKVINENFDSVRAEIIGGCLNTVAKAKLIYPTLTVPNLGRMADFMYWGCSIAEVLGIGGNNFGKIYSENQNKSIQEAIDSHPVAFAITNFLTKRNEWTGSVQSLLNELNKTASSIGLDLNHKLWPKAPKSLSSRLKEVKSNLESIGISYSIRNVGTHKEIRIISKG